MSIREQLLKLRNITSNKKNDGLLTTEPGTNTQFSTLPANSPSKQAIIGLDFGTAFTKAVVGNSTLHQAVEWSIEPESPYLLAGIFYSDENGICSLGNVSEDQYSDLKMKLLNGNPSDDDKIEICIFLALVLQEVRSFVLNHQNDSYSGHHIDWFLNVGLPTDGYHDQELEVLYPHIVSIAWALSTAPMISKKVCKKLMEMEKDELYGADNIIAPDKIFILPEFVAQITGYVSSPMRQNGLHLLVDVGGGTVDITTFNVTQSEDEDDRFPIFAKCIEKLGTTYLLNRRLADAQVQDKGIINPFNKVPSFQRMCELLRIDAQDLRSFDKPTRDALAISIKKLLQYTKLNRHPLSPAWEAGIPTFLCGGGGKCDFYREILNDEKVFKAFPIDIKKLPKPENFIAEKLKVSDYDRLSVAYGLSFHEFNIGEIAKECDVEDVNKKISTHSSSFAQNLVRCDLCNGANQDCFRCNGKGYYDPEVKNSSINSKISTKENMTHHAASNQSNVHLKKEYQSYDGTIYEGDFIDGKLNGKGKSTDPNGTIYEGHFINGKLYGKGKSTDPDGTIYEGDFIDGKLNGNGKSTYPDGTIYEGDFIDGKLNGRSKRTDPDGTIYEGQFINGKLNGKGKSTDPNGTINEGQFISGKLNGKGKSTYPDGTINEGQFINGKLNGMGKKIYRSEYNEEGKFIDGKLSGNGKRTYPDGTIYEGQFTDGKLNGYIKITYPDGEVL